MVYSDKSISNTTPRETLENTKYTMPVPTYLVCIFKDRNEVEIPERVRRPTKEEGEAMLAYTSHADSCRICKDPRSAAEQSGRLCEEGKHHADRVFLYIFANHKGIAYSRDDYGSFIRVQIAIPEQCAIIMELLIAATPGYNLQMSEAVPELAEVGHTAKWESRQY